MDNRINYIIELYSQISDEEVTKHTKINNASIESICAYEGPAFFRVKHWLEKKVGEKVQKDRKGTLDIDGDLESFHRTLNECYELAKDRMPKYGNSWKIMDIKSLALLAMMKMDRIATLGEEHAKTKDEIMDTINYCAFMMIKYNELQNEA